MSRIESIRGPYLPRWIPVTLLAIVVILTGTPAVQSGQAAVPKQARVELKVFDATGTRLLTDAVVHTSSKRVRTSPQALCFGPGTGGKGGFASTDLRRPNAMGLLADAAAELSVLRPLRVTDHYQATFGQGMCGLGGIEASGSLYFALWVGGKFVESSFDRAGVRSGQKVVIHFTEEYPATTIPTPVEPWIGLRPVVGSPLALPVTGTESGDRVLARDGRRDSVKCRGGADLVLADRVDRVDSDCEDVQRG